MRRTDWPMANFSTVTGLAMMVRQYTRPDEPREGLGRDTRRHRERPATSHARMRSTRDGASGGRSRRPSRCREQAGRRDAVGPLRDALAGVVRSRRGRRSDHAVLGALRAARRAQLLAEAGYPSGFDAGELYQLPPYFTLGEAIIGNLQAVGIKLKMRPMERAAYFAAIQSKKAKGVCVCSSALYGNAASRMSEIYPSEGAYAYGGYPDVDALYNQQARETDRKKREALLHQIQQIMNERTRIAPIFEYIWPSGIGPRVADPALMMINPYPWSAPLEDVRLKKM